MQNYDDWWKQKTGLVLKLFGLLMACLLVFIFLAIGFAGSFLISTPIIYWLFVIVLPLIMAGLLFHHNRQDVDIDRRSDHYGLD